MRLGDSIRQHPIRSTLVGLLVLIVVLIVIGALAGGDDEESDTQQQSVAPTQATSNPTAPPPTAPPPTQRPTQPAPTVRPERCNAEMRSSVPGVVRSLRTFGTSSRDMADVLDDFPEGILLPEAVELAYQLYDFADSSYELAEVFPDRNISDDLREFGNFLGATGFFLEYGVTDEDAAEAVEGLREIARQAPRLANQIDNFC